MAIFTYNQKEYKFGLDFWLFSEFLLGMNHQFVCPEKSMLWFILAKVLCVIVLEHGIVFIFILCIKVFAGDLVL